MITICYITSKPTNDVRVFYKECTSLANSGYKVYLISPNAKTEIRNGVNIIGVNFINKSFFGRLILLPRALFKVAVEINADIYHFNDPGCLPYGVKLKNKGKKVIFDSFEDHPLLLLENKRVPIFFMRLLISAYKYYEFKACKRFDAVICCYHWTRERLSKACALNDLIFNFPIVNESNLFPLKKADNIDFTICYAGLLSEIWNIDKIFASLDIMENVHLKIAGHGDTRLVEKNINNKTWKSVEYYGILKREEVFNSIYSCSDVGLALLDYLPLCKYTMGNMSNNKLFEYLLFGLPVICTDFVYWKEIVENNNCGICVNPNDVHAITNAIKYLKDNPDIASKMGQNGRKVVMEKYNWSMEESKLLNIYQKLSMDLILCE
jgi:glycosyltransferase involved in cell wall biosynthesis